MAKNKQCITLLSIHQWQVWAKHFIYVPHGVIPQPCEAGTIIPILWAASVLPMNIQD